jgi:hypothetical protein
MSDSSLLCYELTHAYSHSEENWQKAGAAVLQERLPETKEYKQ